MLDSLQNPTYPKSTKRLLPWLIVLASLLLAFLLVVQWFWLTRAATGVEPQIVLPSERAPLLTSLRAQPPILWSTIIAASALVTALVLAVSPLRWWIGFMAALGWGNGAKLARVAMQQQAQQDVEKWVAEQAALRQVTEAQVNPADPTGVQTTLPDQPVAGAVQQPGVPPTGAQAPGPQPPGTLPPAAPQPGAAPAPGPQPPSPLPPGVPQPGAQPMPPEAQQPGAPPPAAPAAPPPSAAQSSQALQALLVEEDKIDLQELTDIGDILSSFKENDEISPYLLALSQSLDDVEVTRLVARTHKIATALATSTPR